jgi:hypothetical protein
LPTKTITYDIIANDKTTGGLNKAAQQAEGAGSRIKKAFGSALSTINSTGVLGPFGDALANAQSQLDQVGSHVKSVGGKMLGLGTIGVGVGGLLAAAASSDVAAHQQLQQAINNTGESYSDYSGQVDKLIQHETKYGTTAGTTQDALRVLVQSTGSATKAFSYMGVATDLAAAKHISLSDAAQQVARILAGSGTRTLSQFGITAVQTGKGVDKGRIGIELLSQKIKGEANAAADTFSGKMKALKANIENQAASIGAKWAPALMGASAGLSLVGGGVETASALMGKFKTAQEGATVATEGLTTAEEASDAAATANPIGLIVVAVVAVGVAIYELVSHWKQVWGWIKDVIGDAVGFIKKHIDLILAVALGPLGIAIDLLKDHWKQVWSVIQDVLHFAWNSVIKPVFGFIKTVAIDPLKAAFDLFVSGWKLQWSVIQSVMNVAWSVLKPVFGFIKTVGIDVISDAINGFETIWKTAWNGIQDAINTVWGVIKPIIDALTGGLKTVTNLMQDVNPSKLISGGLSAIGLASGTSSASGGLTLVGEQGPELVNLPKGAGVTPAAQTASMLGGGSGPTINLTVYAGMGTDGAAVGQQIINALGHAHTAGITIPSYLTSAA